MRNPSASAAGTCSTDGQEDARRPCRRPRAAALTRSIATRNAGWSNSRKMPIEYERSLGPTKSTSMPVDGGDLLDGLDRLRRLDLRDAERALARRARSRRDRCRSARRDGRARSRASPAARSAAPTPTPRPASAELTCGHITPSTPRSSARARAPAHVGLDAHQRVHARRRQPSSWPSSCDSSPPPCSRSTSSQSNPASPSDSAASGLPSVRKVPNSVSPAARRAFIAVMRPEVTRTRGLGAPPM